MRLPDHRARVRRDPPTLLIRCRRARSVPNRGTFGLRPRRCRSRLGSAMSLPTDWDYAPAVACEQARIVDHFCLAGSVVIQFVATPVGAQTKCPRLFHLIANEAVKRVKNMHSCNCRPHPVATICTPMQTRIHIRCVRNIYEKCTQIEW